MRSFRVVSLGCKVNQYEGEALAQMLESAGLVRSAGAADVVVVNTCTVTASAAAKSRKAVRAERRRSPDSLLVATGCMASHDPGSLAAMAEVNRVIPNALKGAIPVELGVGAHSVAQDELELLRPPERTRAFVRVQDGCEQRCSYCVIPDARGSERSRPAEAVLAEVARLAEQGVGEIVLTGIHLGRYGRGGGGPGGGRRGPDLAALVSRVLELPGSFRLRLSSIEMGEVTDELARLLAQGGRLARHLHLPLQSGSDPVLARMNRPYTAGEFLGRLGRIKELAGDIGVTTDVMVGFPGESEEDFEGTLDVLKRMAPHRVHRFPFSPREGTPAAAMGPAADDGTMRRRMEALGRAASRLWRRYASEFLGRTIEIVAEPGRKPGSIEGYSSEYLRVTAEGAPAATGYGSIIRVSAEALRRGKIVGRMAP